MKHYIKTGASVLLFATFLVFAIGSGDDIDNEDISSVADANELTDKKFKEFNEKYDELCDKKRNDKLKQSFVSLGSEILRYGENIGEAENLDYDEQSKAREYFNKKLDKNHNLEQLTYNNCECW
jgi:hypothetical protein